MSAASEGRRPSTPSPVAAAPPAAAGRPLLRDRAYGEIKGLILSGEWAPGTFLSERRLAAHLGMSKTPVRAALEGLEGEGLVTIAPQRGVLVRVQSLREILDLFDMRLALETFVVGRLAGRLGPAEAERLRANLEAQAACVEAGDAPGLTALDTQFHLLLCELLGNREIAQAMRPLRDRLHRIIAGIFTQNLNRPGDAYLEHAEIARSLVAGEGGRASEAMERHIEWGRQALVSSRSP